MPTHHQTTVDPVSTTRGLGASDTATMQSMFPASPIHSGELTRDAVKALGDELLVGTEVNDGGHTFGTFNRDYVGAPNPAEVETGGGGLPGSAWTPAPGSPGPGSMNPTDIPAPPAGWPGSPGVEYGSGETLPAPNTTSTRTAGQKIGDYVLGRSYTS